VTDFDSTMRVQTLQTIKAKLHALINRPPREHGNAYKVDLAQVEKVLIEIRPFWDAYLAVTKPRDNMYGLRNMNAEEREMYLTCEFWLERLESLAGLVAKEQVVKTSTGGI